jgi:excisionase family DNA binding protein
MTLETQNSESGRVMLRPAMVTPRLLRVTEAARYLSTGTKAIRALIQAGALPYVQLRAHNSPFLIDVRDLDAFIDARKIPARN